MFYGVVVSRCSSHQTVGANATRKHGFFCAFCPYVKILFDRIYCYSCIFLMPGVADVQGFGLKAASRSEDGYEHPASSFSGGVSSRLLAVLSSRPFSLGNAPKFLLTFSNAYGYGHFTISTAVSAPLFQNYARSCPALLLGFFLGYNALSSSIFCRVDNPEYKTRKGNKGSVRRRS